jgi:hypothetical protein
VPYLLRAVLPSGLPRLKSLEIEQEIAGWGNRKLEGVLWYETLNGDFCIEKKKKNIQNIPRNFMNGYLHSVVRGAPNLEELGLHGMTLSSDSLVCDSPGYYSLRLKPFIPIENSWAYLIATSKVGKVLLPRVFVKSKVWKCTTAGSPR